MENKSHYQTLGVSRDASDEEIKRAFRKLARKYHPDVASGASSETRFKEVNEAYEVLKDPEKRAAYDNPQPQAEFTASPDWDGGFGFSHPGAGNSGGFSDIFERFHKSDPCASGFGGGMAAMDQHARLEIPLSEAFLGATRNLNLQMPKINSKGEVSFTERNIAVKIPKGITEGQNIRLRGEGMQLEDGKNVGDLYLEIVFAPHPVYRPEGRDLHLDLPVSPWEAALGQKIVLPTPDGKVDLKIPKNARSGQKLRLKGKGLPARPPGDIYATLRIVNPKIVSPKEQELFETMARDTSFNPRAGMGG
ncbi:MAG: DnaJ C-terminal domain-containing protein [Paracoccaceae bacterium]